MSRRNIKISDDVYQRHKARKDYYGLTWENYLDAGCPDIPLGELEDHDDE